MLTNRQRAQRKYARRELAEQLAAMVTASQEDRCTVYASCFNCPFHEWVLVPIIDNSHPDGWYEYEHPVLKCGIERNWQWWLHGQKVADIDEALFEAHKAWAVADNYYALHPSPGAEDDREDARRQWCDCHVFHFNTRRIELNTDLNRRLMTYACYRECRYHAARTAYMTECKDLRWDVWEDNHAAVRSHYADFLAYERANEVTPINKLWVKHANAALAELA